MDSQTLVDRLVDAGVFEPVGDGDDLRVGDAFQRAVEANLETIESADDGTHLFEEFVDDADVRATLRNAVDDDPEFFARYLTLAEWLDGLTHRQTLDVAIVVHQFTDEPPRADGAPADFLPIRGETLGTVASLYERSIVYIWRDQCPACETVREDFEAIFADGTPEDVALLSVYGPDCARYLQEEFDVVGGPTVLYVRNGEVETRLQGANGRAVLENEIELLAEDPARP
jgi:hypothetical protein